MFLRFLMSWITITIVAALLLLGGLGVLGWQWTVNTVSAGADDSEQDASTHRTSTIPRYICNNMRRQP